MIRVLLFILIIFLVICFKEYFLAVAMFTGGSDTPKVFYHGSPNKIPLLEPRAHYLAKDPVVFATPSYTDAVIFSSWSSDYEFSMYDSDGVRVIEEQYPGGFDILKRPGYIHTLDGETFRPLGTGTRGEYISNEAQKPIKIEEVIPWEYLAKVPAAKLKMITYAESVKNHENPENILSATDINDNHNNMNNILCVVTTHDDKATPAQDAIKSIVAAFGKTSRPIKIITIWDLDNKLSSDYYYVVVGDDIEYTIRIETSRPKFFINLPLDNYLSVFTPREQLPVAKYTKYLESRPNLFLHWTQVHPGPQMMDPFKDIVNQVADVVISGSNVVPHVLYHGSPNKIPLLEPRAHYLAKSPVVFGTPSYTDAVIFSSYSSDYDFGMWNDDGCCILEEQFPGAFDIFKKTTYIHTLDGTSFKPLGSGLGNEYISTKAQKPIKIEEIIPWDYLAKVPAAELKMIPYADAIKSHEDPKIKLASELNGNHNDMNSILCVVMVHDHRAPPAVAVIESIVDKLAELIKSRPIKQIHTWDLERKLSNDKYYVVVGDDILMDTRYQTNRPKYFINLPLSDYMSAFTPAPKVPFDKYYKYMEYRVNFFHHWTWLRPGPELLGPFEDIACQVALRERFPTTHIIAVVAPSGAGKTTMCNRLSAAGKHAIDTDDITDTTGDGPEQHHLAYDKLGEEIGANGDLIVCGLTIPLGYLADIVYYLDVSPAQIYKQLISRTVPAICAAELSFKGTTPEELDAEYMAISRKYKIRNPGFLSPSDVINNGILMMRNNWIAAGAIPLSPDDLFKKITEQF